MAKSTTRTLADLDDDMLSFWKAATLAVAEITPIDESATEEVRTMAAELLRESYPVHALAAFSPDTLPDDVKRNYMYWLLEHEKTQNSYYIVRIFTYFVRNGINPPKWVLESLAEGFRKHILDSDPSKLAKQLGLIGKESGADNPAAEVARRLYAVSAYGTDLDLV